MMEPIIISIEDLKDAEAISERCRQSNAPVFIEENGRVDMVMMSMKVYEEKMLALDPQIQVMLLRLREM